MFHKSSLILLGALMSQATLAEQAPENTLTHEFMLENGLKLIVQEDHRAPVVVTKVWYKVGASYEHEGITGISHMLEHMMFKGTTSLKPNEFSQIIAENGGKENAFTSSDYTAYYQQLEKSRLPISFKLEADRMRNLVLDETEFEKERKVVTEERRMRTDDQPSSLAFEKIQAAAFQTSPYRNPVIGWMADIYNYELDDLRDWYNMWYAPNNATVVVVGDVNPHEVYALAQEHFGPLKPETLAEIKPRPEIPQTGEKRLVIKDNVRVPSVMLAYKAPGLVPAIQNKDAQSGSEEEVYALEVLASALDGGDSSRLTRNLIRDQEIASSTWVYYNLLSRLDTLFMLSGTPAQGKSVEEVETALRDQIATLKSELLTDSELARVKAQNIADEVYQKDSMYYQARVIGTLETVGLDWQLRDKYVEKINAVTAEQVRAAAQKYLIDDHLTVAVLKAKDAPEQLAQQ